MEQKFTVPCDVGLERDVLSAVIYNPELVDIVCYELNSSDFHFPVHVEIFGAIKALNDENVNISPDVLFKRFEGKHIGVVNAILDLMNQYFSTDMLQMTIRQLKAISLKRSMFRAAESGLTLFNGPSEVSPAATLGWIDSVRNISTGYQSSKYRSISEVLEKPHDHVDKTFLQILQERQELYRSGKEVFTGHKTGFVDLDKMFSGFNNGHLTLIGARPAVGKTTFMVNLVLNQLANGVACGVFSLEMPTMQIVERMVYCSAEVDWKMAKEGKISSDEFREIMVKSKDLEATTCMIDDKARADLHLITSRSHHWKDRYGIKIIFIDYLGLIKGTGKFNNKYEEITHISQQMKVLAKELDLPVICLAQLNRGIESKEIKAPQASDLRDSGSLEQDADEIMLLHKPSLYDPMDKPGILQVFLRKNRSGPTGKCDLQLNGATGKIHNLARFEDEFPNQKNWSVSSDP